MKEKNIDLFGDEIIEDSILRSKFIEPPFSVIDSKSGRWQDRKNMWKNKCIKSELGRKAKAFNMKDWGLKNDNELPSDTSIFDPALCELMYHWFCPQNGYILDPFCGGSVRGIVANYLLYKYVGIDIRQEQIDANRLNCLDVLPVNNQPQYYCGDSNDILNNEWLINFDFIFSCPPYFNLEVYSDLDGDISNMNYNDFIKSYESIILKSTNLLNKGCFAVFVVGEVRDKEGNYIGFVPDTINAFKKAGMYFYNEAIFLNTIASASIRANRNMKSKKLVKVHQNILIFKKGEK